MSIDAWGFASIWAEETGLVPIGHRPPFRVLMTHPRPRVRSTPPPRLGSIRSRNGERDLTVSSARKPSGSPPLRRRATWGRVPVGQWKSRALRRNERLSSRDIRRSRRYRCGGTWRWGLYIAVALGEAERASEVWVSPVSEAWGRLVVRAYAMRVPLTRVPTFCGVSGAASRVAIRREPSQEYSRP